MDGPELQEVTVIVDSLQTELLNKVKKIQEIKLLTELRSVTCHMGSYIVTCHSTQV